MGPCPGCPEGGGEGWRGVVERAAHCIFSPAFPGKRVEDPCIHWTTLGPGSSPMISLVPGPARPVPASCRCPSCCDRQGPILKSPSESDTTMNMLNSLFTVYKYTMCYAMLLCFLCSCLPSLHDLLAFFLQATNRSEQ